LFTRSILRGAHFCFTLRQARSSFSPIISHGTRHGPSSNPLIVHISASPDPAKVLTIDDEIGPRESLRKLLKPSYQVHTAENVERTRLQRQSEVTERELHELNERLRNELAQKERLASLGQASAEFVHDLSNPLTIVWGYVQILSKKLEQSGDGINGDRSASSP